MSQGASRLTPQHINWDRDLPAQGSPHPQARADLHGTLNELQPGFVELGRPPSANRGALTVVCSVFALLAMYFGIEVWLSDPGLGEAGSREFSLLVTGCAGVLLVMCWGGLRFDTDPPRDMPVRFNRQTGKVYFNGYRMNFNPFGRWGAEIKSWDWRSVQAEVVRTAGFTGKVYQVRYFLVLSSCRPGSNEVLDREVLAGPSMTSAEFDDTWTYLCRYMAEGAAAVPEQPARDRGVYFWRSFFEYAEWLAPTRWGREARQRASRAEKAFLVVASPVLLLLLPVSLLFGVGHYVAMKLADEARWPAGVDTESRGV